MDKTRLKIRLIKCGCMLSFILLLYSCELLVMDNSTESSPEKVFQALWENVDQKYSFFDYKGINWQEQYNRYSNRIYNDMPDEELFDVLFQMLTVLEDAHVNLWSPFNVARYEKVFLNSPVNFDFRLIKEYYLKDDYYITGPFYNQFLYNGEIGYVFYGSFVNYVSDTALNYVINRFRNTRGLIFDVRGNGGGAPEYAKNILSRFADVEREALLSYVKNGPGHNQFSDPKHLIIKPYSQFNYTRPIVILTNRGSFSATNFFVAAAKAFPHIVQIGDTTGGGGGIPAFAELPNGWNYRFSASRTTTPDGFNIENGVPPDIPVNINTNDDTKDEIIEAAIEYLLLPGLN